MEQTSLAIASAMIFTTLFSFAWAPSFDAITSCSPVRISRAELADCVGMGRQLSDMTPPFQRVSAGRGALRDPVRHLPAFGVVGDGDRGLGPAPGRRVMLGVAQAKVA